MYFKSVPGITLDIGNTEIKDIFLLSYNLMCVCVLSSVLALCDSLDCSLPGFSIHRICPVKILGWIIITSSRASS